MGNLLDAAFPGGPTSAAPNQQGLYDFLSFLSTNMVGGPVVPGDQLTITCELISLKRNRFGKVRGEATVQGQLVCSGELMFSLVD